MDTVAIDKARKIIAKNRIGNAHNIRVYKDMLSVYAYKYPAKPGQSKRKEAIFQKDDFIVSVDSIFVRLLSKVKPQRRSESLMGVLNDASSKVLETIVGSINLSTNVVLEHNKLVDNPIPATDPKFPLFNSYQKKVGSAKKRKFEVETNVIPFVLETNIIGLKASKDILHGDKLVWNDRDGAEGNSSDTSKGAPEFAKAAVGDGSTAYLLMNGISDPVQIVRHCGKRRKNI